jgi:hypothetical protein
MEVMMKSQFVKFMYPILHSLFTWLNVPTVADSLGHTHSIGNQIVINISSYEDGEHTITVMWKQLFGMAHWMGSYKQLWSDSWYSMNADYGFNTEIEEDVEWDLGTFFELDDNGRVVKQDDEIEALLSHHN